MGCIEKYIINLAERKLGMTNNKYFMGTDQSEEKRLEMLNKIYNPFTFNFLQGKGLTNGMTILEYGCGLGIVAIELAKHIGRNGQVIAIDSSEFMLEKARQRAKKANVNNIEFKCCNIEGMLHLDQTFDLIYGRWVLIFTHNTKKVLENLIVHLKPGGSLICEELNFLESGCFSYPSNPLVDKYHKIIFDNSAIAKLHENTASTLYHEFNQQYLENIYIKANQPILVDHDEKSIYRLGLLSMYKTILSNQLCTENDLNSLIDQFIHIEENDTVLGTYRNLLISGTKPLK
jgi:ubiquinone/menaquinone biosynthesis C-methylase UbiE